MFLEKEARPAGEPEVKITKLSQAIRAGAPFVREVHDRWLTKYDGNWCGCAIGTAAYAMGYRGAYNEHADVMAMKALLAGLQGGSMIDYVCSRHIRRDTRENIAKYLEAQGY